MNRLAEHQQELYELRFSPMCKPAAEVANLTQLEGHHVRARTMIMWRIAAGHLSWGQREVEILYQSTLDSISEAFDIFHYPISRYMLDARADVWEAGLVPKNIENVVENNSNTLPVPPKKVTGGSLLLAGEINQINGSDFGDMISEWLPDIQVWPAATGVLPYVLGAREVARTQAEYIIEGIEASGAKSILVDGPETAWGLRTVYADLGVEVPEDIDILLFSTYLLKQNYKIKNNSIGKVFIHDSRPACLIAEKLPSHLAILPGYSTDEFAFGEGEVFDAPRQLIDMVAAARIFGTWTRCLAKSCGADDGLWLTYPNLARGLARQRLDYVKSLGAELVVTDSPLCANFLKMNSSNNDLPVYWLPELVLEQVRSLSQ